MAANTRERIMDTALACFIEHGYEQTTIVAIRERSGVSNGALFHHFPTKESIAEALYVEALGSFQEGLWRLIRRRPRSLRVAVRATIAHQLGWIEAHSDLARFVYARGHLDWESPGAAAVQSRNRELAAAFRHWLDPLVEAGEVRPASMLVITAIVCGPAHAIAQRWLAGQLERAPSEYVGELSLAAWAGLRGTPAPAARAGRRAPTRGRVTLELISGEGRVLASGQASAELQALGTGAL
ncbi:MAG TPA: TetR/AcrR family transcriptional regulator [Solirubrobacteraceae bacterium]|jgi:AcrR family transcriptional regulator|nr:TetR/AcrR family transcriptional regulator [Solirubrobacteraceae bacterium]